MAAPKGYSRIQILLHWVIALLIVVQYIFAENMEQAWHAIERGQTPQGSTYMLHVYVGIAILAFVVWRFAVRMMRGAPELPPNGNPLLDKIAVATHWSIYALIALVPITGLIAWYGGIGVAGGLHGLLFNLLFALVILHVVGAFYHQFVAKDGLMDRMRKPG